MKNDFEILDTNHIYIKYKNNCTVLSKFNEKEDLYIDINVCTYVCIYMCSRILIKEKRKRKIE